MATGSSVFILAARQPGPVRPRPGALRPILLGFQPMAPYPAATVPQPHPPAGVQPAAAAAPQQALRP